MVGMTIQTDEQPSGAGTTPDRFDVAVAGRYDSWFASPAGALAQRLQHRMMLQLLAPQPGDSILDVGCGTGETMRLLTRLGVHTTGLDRAPAMLAAARRKLGGASLIHGDAVNLPFPDARFDAAILNTTLEFLPDPVAAVRELARVTRRRVYIGALNRWSMLAIRRRLAARRVPSLYRDASFLTVGDLLRLLDEAGTTRWRWGGVAYLPARFARRAVLSRLIGATCGWPNPFAAYLGCAADIDRLEFALAQPDRHIGFSVATQPAAAIVLTTQASHWIRGLGRAEPHQAAQANVTGQSTTWDSAVTEASVSPRPLER